MLFRVTCGLGNWRLSVCNFRVKIAALLPLKRFIDKIFLITIHTISLKVHKIENFLTPILEFALFLC